MKLLSFSYSEGGEWVKLVISEPQLPAERKVKDDCMETVFFFHKVEFVVHSSHNNPPYPTCTRHVLVHYKLCPLCGRVVVVNAPLHKWDQQLLGF